MVAHHLIFLVMQSADTTAASPPDAPQTVGSSGDTDRKMSSPSRSQNI